MKTVHYIVLLTLGVFLFASCKKYLDKTPASDVTEKDIFSTYESFQGFIDPNYAEVIDYSYALNSTMDYGGEIYSYLSWSPGQLGTTGNYWTIGGSDGNPSLFKNSRRGPRAETSGIWNGGWHGIRRCNLALQNIALLSDATDEEKQLILGQIYFFRAFFHAEIISGYGGMPYIDTVYSATDADELKEPRITYQECTEKIVADYDKAIALLPVNWDQTVVGGQRPGANIGRVTKGVALSYKQKALLYAGSPLMNKFSGNDYTYNKGYCERAASAGWEMIQLARSGEYALTPFANYLDMFNKNNGTVPWTTESIFWSVMAGYRSAWSQLNLIYLPGRLGGVDNCESVNQWFVDFFEMADGTRYKPEYDNDNTKRWNFRDPRFRKNIYVDRDKAGIAATTVLNLYVGTGSDKTVQNKVATPYIIKKFASPGANSIDKVYSQNRFLHPRMRLAEVYLDYAEAVTAAYGPSGKATGSDLTAVDAINIIRGRAGMPDVTSDATGYPSFMDLVWNERKVELCFEGHFWMDIRRWHVGHLPEYKSIIDLNFDKSWTKFDRSVIATRVFDDPKHYWLPLPLSTVFLYKEMYQNPGWE